MTRQVIDLGWALGVIEPSDQGWPQLQIMWPSTTDDPAGDVVLYDPEGLRNLVDVLSEVLNEYENEQEAKNGKQNTME